MLSGQHPCIINTFFTHFIDLFCLLCHHIAIQKGCVPPVKRCEYCDSINTDDVGVCTSCGGDPTLLPESRGVSVTSGVAIGTVTG